MAKTRRKEEVSIEDEGGKGLEKKVVEALDFEDIGDAIVDKTQRVAPKISDAKTHFDKLYAGQQKKAGYNLDAIASKDAGGVPIYKVRGINDQMLTEDIADNLGRFFALKHNRPLAHEIQELKDKLSGKKKLDKGKEETEASVRRKLEKAREELKDLGFDWNGVKKYLGDYGLKDELRDQIKESYEKHAPMFEASEHLSKITDDHKSPLIEYLKKKHPKFVKYALGYKLSLDELKDVFVQTHTFYDMHKEPEKQDLLEKAMYDRYSHLYRSNAAKPVLREPKKIETGRYKEASGKEKKTTLRKAA